MFGAYRVTKARESVVEHFDFMHISTIVERDSELKNKDNTTGNYKHLKNCSNPQVPFCQKNKSIHTCKCFFLFLFYCYCR